jgi:hypothetical protein
MTNSTETKARIKINNLLTNAGLHNIQIIQNSLKLEIYKNWSIYE